MDAAMDDTVHRIGGDLQQNVPPGLADLEFPHRSGLDLTQGGIESRRLGLSVGVLGHGRYSNAARAAAPATILLGILLYYVALHRPFVNDEIGIRPE
jgi:hypothetical protein